MNNAEFYYQYASVSAFLLSKESRTIIGSMESDDQIIHVARQRRISGAVVSPSVVIVSKNRVIIVNRWVGGVKSEISFIPYQNIVSVRISHGVLFSSLFVRIKGSSKEKAMIFGTEKEEGEINGLNRVDAEAIFINVNRTLHEYEGTIGGDKEYHMHGNVTNNIYVDPNTVHGWNHSEKVREGYVREGEAPVQAELDGVSSYMLGSESSEMKCLTYVGPQLYTANAESSSKVAVNNGEVAHTVKADDLLIFKKRKEVKPEDLKIFKLRSSRFGWL